MSLTVFEAHVGGASGVRTLDGASAVHRNVVVGARVVRAERLAALGHFALDVVTLKL